MVPVKDLSDIYFYGEEDEKTRMKKKRKERGGVRGKVADKLACFQLCGG